MDRQEAIQTLSKVGKIPVSYAEDLYDSLFPKPVVPQFVADWIDDKSGLFGLNYDSASDELYDWVYANEENIKKLHLAFVRGYEVEKEKRYLVKVCRINEDSAFFNHDILGDDWYLADKTNSSSVKTYHTRKELEDAGFGEVFNSASFEVEEVE